MYVSTLYRFISIYFRTVIRFYAEYIYSGCDSVRVYSNSFIRPHLNDFIWTLNWYFIFIILISSNQDFISNVAGRIAIASEQGRDVYANALEKLSSNTTSYEDIKFLLLSMYTGYPF